MSYTLRQACSRKRHAGRRHMTASEWREVLLARKAAQAALAEEERKADAEFLLRHLNLRDEEEEELEREEQWLRQFLFDQEWGKIARASGYWFQHLLPWKLILSFEVENHIPVRPTVIKRTKGRRGKFVLDEFGFPSNLMLQ